MHRLLWLTLVLGCSDKDGDDTGGGADSADSGDSADSADSGEEELTQEELFAKWVTVTDAAVGDMACYDGTAWVSESPAAACQTVAEIGEGQVTDFANGGAIAGAEVSYYFGDTVSDPGGYVATSDAEGYITGSLPVCRPVACKVSTTDGLTQDTYEFHIIYGAGSTVNPDPISVLSDTWITIPSIFGVTIVEGKGVVAGEAQDCNGDTLQNAQVILRDAAGDIPPDMALGYTFNGIPSRTYKATTEDGVWIAMNVPPGDYTAEMYVSDGAKGQTLVGKAPVSAFADSVSIVIVVGGREDGLDYPESCTTCAD